MNTVMNKTCPKCGSTERVKRGNSDRCAECNRHTVRAWKAKNKAKVEEYNKQWYSKNVDRINEKRRSRYPDIAESDREKSKAWSKKNPDKKAKSGEKWRANNPDKVRDRVRKWQANNPGKVRELHRRRRARIKGADGDISDFEWQNILEFYNHTCLCCGATEELTQDHVIPLSKGGSHSPDNIQPLCRTCNLRKHVKIIDYRGDYGS